MDRNQVQFFESKKVETLLILKHLKFETFNYCMKNKIKSIKRKEPAIDKQSGKYSHT